MRQRVICFRGVHNGRNGFVYEELERCEWNSHGKCRWVGDVECSNAFASVDIFGAIGHGFVQLARIMDLHTLLNHCRMSAYPNHYPAIIHTVERIHQCIAGNCCASPTSGWEIVSQEAILGVMDKTNPQPEDGEHQLDSLP